MRHHNSMLERNWSSAGAKGVGFQRWSRYFQRRLFQGALESPPRGGTAGPAAKDPPKNLREQYGISAMIYGLVVLLGGIYCAMTDAGRLASERGFALDAITWSPRLPPARGAARAAPSMGTASALPSSQSFSESLLPTPPRVPPARGEAPAAAPKSAAPARVGSELPDVTRQPGAASVQPFLEETGAAGYGESATGRSAVG